jgi:hypothetical protein
MTGTEVQVWQHIVSKVPGRVGNWSISRKMTLARVPVAGDVICHHDGWASLTVKRVTLGPGFDARVDVIPVSTDSPQILDELELLVKNHGWLQHGAPWGSA